MLSCTFGTGSLMGGGTPRFIPGVTSASGDTSASGASTGRGSSLQKMTRPVTVPVPGASAAAPLDQAAAPRIAASARMLKRNTILAWPPLIDNAPAPGIVPAHAFDECFTRALDAERLV